MEIVMLLWQPSWQSYIEQSCTYIYMYVGICIYVHVYIYIFICIDSFLSACQHIAHESDPWYISACIHICNHICYLYTLPDTYV